LVIVGANSASLDLWVCAGVHRKTKRTEPPGLKADSGGSVLGNGRECRRRPREVRCCAAGRSRAFLHFMRSMTTCDTHVVQFLWKCWL